MKIEEEMFCVLIDEKRQAASKFVKVIGTGGIKPGKPPILVRDASNDVSRCNEGQLVPLVRKCDSPQEAWRRHQPEIIINLAVMVHDLQGQDKKLQEPRSQRKRSHPAEF